MRITDPRDPRGRSMARNDPRERRRHRAPEADHLAAAVRLDLSLADMRARDTAAGAPARDDDEPPTGLIDLNAIRALLGQPTTGEVDPAAAAWLAGGADPAAARVVEEVDYLDQIAQAQPLAGTYPAGETATYPISSGDPLDDEGPRAPTSLREHFDEQLAAATAAINATADQRAALELTAERLAEVAPLPTGLEYTCEVLGNAFHTAPCGDAQHPPAVLDVPPLADKAAAVLLPDVFAAERHRFDPAFIPERRSGWQSRHDVRSRSFGVRAQLPDAAPLADRLWWPGTVGDQGTEGACVGWGIVDAVNARAAGDVDLTAADAAALYERARQLDEVPGESYSGTSVLAGLKAAQERGLIGAYSWCFGTRDIAQAVLQAGPVVVGVPWLSGMYDTAPGGLVQLAGTDTGAGHCLAVVGILLRGPSGQPGPYFVWQNSWGPDYGDGGLGYIHHRDLAQLLQGVGEAAVPAPPAVRSTLQDRR